MTKIENPKMREGDSHPSTWFRFYPGFSESFARSALSFAGLKEGDWVLDPWNGGGTTTSTAASVGLNVCGYDLNPVMVIVAKARCLHPAEYSSLKPLAVDINRKARRPFEISAADPLLTWLLPSSVAALRGIEAAIQKLLIDDGKYVSVRARGTDVISDLAGFFYVALFRTLRNILRPFRTSNPTWLTKPATANARLRPSRDYLRTVFRAEIVKMLSNAVAVREAPYAKRILKVASSDRLPLQAESVNFILTSPPYCTRIDYAVATFGELSLLGFGPLSGFEQLRRVLIGSATVPKAAPSVLEEWGKTCLRFLEGLRTHTSKASATYYYKNHLQYFSSLSASVFEMSRVLSVGGRCVLVVQDSYYKDLHNDLPTMITEMAALRGLALASRLDFALSRTMAGIHPCAKEYRTSFGATESVLTLEKSTCSTTQQINHIPNVVQPVRCDVLGALGEP